MTNEELKEIWAQHPASDRSIRLAPEAIWQLAEESARFERTITWRDAREWGATVLIAGALLFFAFWPPAIHWLPIIAAILVCLPMTYASAVRRKRPAPEPSRSLGEHLRDSIASVQLQIRLLRAVLWWYLAPIALVMLLVSFDDRLFRRLHFDARFFVMNAVTLAVFYGIWRLNQRAVRKDLEPRLRELEGTLAELEA